MPVGCRWCGHLPLGTPTRARGSLHLAGEPPHIFAGGYKLPLSPTRAAVLTILVQKGFASHAELLALRPTMTPESLKVAIHYLRALIPDDMEILNDFAKGYALTERRA